MFTTEDKNQIISMIQQELKNNFSKKIGDMPTDALQLTPKGYVNQYVLYGQINADGSAAYLPPGWTSSKTATGNYKVVHNLNTTKYGVVACPLFSSDSRMTAIILSKNLNDFTIDTLLTVSTDTDNPSFFVLVKQP